MDFPTLRLEIADTTATILLNRPEQRNALSLQMCDDLIAAMDEVRSLAQLRVLLFRGAGPAFCAGADLREREGKGPEWVHERRRRAFAAYDAIAECELPCVAVIHGPAIGSGCEIAASCDFIYASEKASFRYPEIGWGTVGATQRLPRIVGKALAKELLFTGRTVSAEEAVRIRLINRAVPEAELESAVEALARDLAKQPPLALHLAKHCIDLGMETDLHRGIAIEMMAIDRSLADKEWREGLKEFSGRREGKRR